jgi:hypothetical protein
MADVEPDSCPPTDRFPQTVEPRIPALSLRPVIVTDCTPRVAGDQGARRHPFGDHGPSRNKRTVTDFDPIDNHRTGADCNLLANPAVAGNHCSGMNGAIAPYVHVVPNRYPSANTDMVANS